MKTKLINLMAASRRAASPIAVAVRGGIAGNGPARLRSVLRGLVSASFTTAQPVAGNTSKLLDPALLSSNADQWERFKAALYPGGNLQVVGRYL